MVGEESEFTERTMAKPLKPKKHKVAPKKVVEEDKKIVLVGTYKSGQLEKWPGYYNYPICDGDKIELEFAKKVNEIWLFNAKKEPICLKAEFIGFKTRDELKTEYGYPATGKPHGTGNYILYSTSKTQIYNPASGLAEKVIVRLQDFATSKSVQKKLRDYLDSPDRKDPLLANCLPPLLTKLPPEVLRVCEAAVQTDFLSVILPKEENFVNGISPKYRVASLFAGCGGLDLGFQGGFEFLGKKYAHTGFGVCWANEINSAACKTYSRNLGADIICGDIKDVIKTLPKEVDVVMGGFPCQDISINGKMLGIKGRRSCLYTYIIDAVKKTNPKVFVAENVGSLMLKQNEYSLKTILHDFKSLGYDVTYHVYHAEEYGVPQTRERVIFVGTRKDIGKFTAPAPLQAPVVTAGEALRDLEDAPQSKAFSHVWSLAAPSGEQGSRRLVENRPGYTIRAECHGNIQFHYRLPRRISMREAARIQSFPDSFMFPCGIRETERQIGNAVPPVLAWHVAMAVRRTLEGDHE